MNTYRLVKEETLGQIKLPCLKVDQFCRAPSFGDRKSQYLDDIAILTGGVAGGNGEQVLSRDVTVEKVVLEQSNSQYELQGEYVLLENEAY
ncbi:hypothetical protein Lser_V15G21873 [Lactuca serriola]